MSVLYKARKLQLSNDYKDLDPAKILTKIEVTLKTEILNKNIIINNVKEMIEMEIIENIEISKIKRNENQPRKVFDVEMLNELAESIKEHGVIQPIILIDKGDYYQIVAGERRWRASIIAGLDKIPAIVRNYDEKLTVKLL